MKILLVANGFPPTAYGGVETYVHEISLALENLGHDVLVFCRESRHDLPDYTVLRDQLGGTKIIRVVNDFKNLQSLPETFIDQHVEQIFKGYLSELQPDIIHFNHWIALSARLPTIATACQIPIISTLHDYWPVCQRVHLLDWRGQRCPGLRKGGDCYRCVVASQRGRALLRQSLRLAKRLLPFRSRRAVRRLFFRDPGVILALKGKKSDFVLREKLFHQNLSLSSLVLAPSMHVRTMYERNGFSDLGIEVLPLGAELSGTSNDKQNISERLILGFVGTVLPTKGLHVLIDAMGNVPHADLELHIHGRSDVDPGYTRRMQALAKNDNRIRFFGPFELERRREIYERMDLLAIPSLVHETFSRVAREALISGVPVIASRVGALPEVIEDGVNGFLFNPGDSEVLGEIISKVAASPELIQSLRVPGPASILTVAQHVDRLEAFYSQCVG